MRTLVPIVVLSMSIPLFAQETRPDSDLARENRELKEYIAHLEKRLGELNSRLDEKDKAGWWRIVPVPVPPSAPFWYDVPNPFERQPQTKPFPWRLDPPSTRPAPNRPSTRPSPFFAPHPRFDPSPPPGSQRFRFNGQDVYVIPLRPGDE